MTTESRFGLDRIGQIAVNVKDLDRATAFYRDALGMRPLFQAPRLAFFDCGGIRLMLSLPEKPEFDHPGSILYYKVDDIKAAHTALRGRGVPFEGEPHVVAQLPAHDLWMAFCRDSEGNLLALMSEVRRAA
ncbi:MAG: glyoxalase [Acidobacteria bacterium 13_1_40CM_2_68_5]|nr:MAG: glyoxalase [Acidobacteria bacterium 13_1_40CM_2_68_5]OLE66747.1 MAG: glyoxalase [Acidobacteria bacterium 13_1_20CM_2_68_7]